MTSEPSKYEAQTTSKQERIPELPSAYTGPKARSRDTGGRTGQLLVSAVGSQQLCFGPCFQ